MVSAMTTDKCPLCGSPLRHPFRVVVRGTRGSMRKRLVFTTPALNEAEAVQLAKPRIERACASLDDLYLTVLPPLVREEEPR